MGITVLSGASLGLIGQATGAQSSSEGAGNDFAALLGQQLLAPELLDPQLLDFQRGLALAGNEPANEPGKPGTADIRADDEEKADDPNAALAAAGLLPALMAAAGLPLPTEKPATLRPDEGGKMAGQDILDSGNIDTAGLMAQTVFIGHSPAKAGEIAKAADGNALQADVLKGSTSNAAQEMLSLLGNTNATGANEEAANIAVDRTAEPANGQDFATALAAHVAQPGNIASHHENVPAAAQATVSTPIHDGRWAQDFGEKIVWLAKTDQQVAQLNINPPQLGPMHITLNLNGDQASALFVSPHAEVRQIIEDAMPRLREVLADAGINLGQANVGTQLPQQNGGSSPQSSGTPRSSNDEAILRGENGQDATTPLPAMRSGRGMVDLFA